MNIGDQIDTTPPGQGNVQKKDMEMLSSMKPIDSRREGYEEGEKP